MRTVMDVSKRSSREVLCQWLPAALSAAGALGLSLYLALRNYQVDIDVYRMGGQHILSPDLYSCESSEIAVCSSPIPRSLLSSSRFSPLTWASGPCSAAWAVINVVTLGLPLFVDSDRGSEAWPHADAALGVASVVPSIGIEPGPQYCRSWSDQPRAFGLLITWDLATDRKIGRTHVAGRSGDRAGSGRKAHPPHLRAVPHHHPPCPRSPQCGTHVHRVRVDRLHRFSPKRSMDLLGRTMLSAHQRAAGAMLYSSDQNLSERSAEDPSRLSSVVVTVRSAPGYWCSGFGAPQHGRIHDRRSCSGFWCVQRQALSSHPSPGRPSHGVGGASNRLAGRRSRPAATRSGARGHRRGALRRCSHLVGAHVLGGYENPVRAASESLAAPCRQLLFLCHVGLLGGRRCHAYWSKRCPESRSSP